MNTLTTKYAINGALIGLIATLVTWFICLAAISSTVRESTTAITKVMQIGPLTIGEISKLENGSGSTVTITGTVGLAWLVGMYVITGITLGVILARRKVPIV